MQEKRKENSSLKGKIRVDIGQVYFYPKESKNKPIFNNVCECIAVVILMDNDDKYCYHKFFKDSPLKIIQEFEKFNINKDKIKRIAFFGGSLKQAIPREGDKLYIKEGSHDGGGYEYYIAYNPKRTDLSIESSNYISKYRYDFIENLEDSLLDKKTGIIDSKKYFEGVFNYSKKDSLVFYEKQNPLKNTTYSLHFKTDKFDNFSAYRNIKIMTKILKSLYGNDIVDKIFHFNTKDSKNIIIDKHNKAIISKIDTSAFKEPRFENLNPEEQSKKDTTLREETIQRWASDSSIYREENNKNNNNMKGLNVYEIYPQKIFFSGNNNNNNKGLIKALKKLSLPAIDFANIERNESNGYTIDLANRQLELERKQKEERLTQEALKEYKEREGQESTSPPSILPSFFRIPNFFIGSTYFRNREKHLKKKSAEGRSRVL